MSYRFYVIDHYTGKTWGTNNKELAEDVSLDQEFYVIDSEEALLILQREGEPIKDLEEIRS